MPGDLRDECFLRIHVPLRVVVGESGFLYSLCGGSIYIPLAMGQCLSQVTKEDSMGDQGLLSFGPMAVNAPRFDGDCKVDVQRSGVIKGVGGCGEGVQGGVARQRRRVAVAAQGTHSLTYDAITKYPKTNRVFQMLLRVMADGILFQGLSLSAKQAIVESMSPQYVEAGSDVIRQGELDGQELYIVENGTFSVTKRFEREDTEEVVLLGSDFGTSLCVFSWCLS